MTAWYLHSKMTKAEGKLVLRYMQEIIDKYGNVTVADLYDLIDIKPVYLDSKKGWYSLKNARVSLFRKHGKYALWLPSLRDIM